MISILTFWILWISGIDGDMSNANRIAVTTFEDIFSDRIMRLAFYGDDGTFVSYRLVQRMKISLGSE